MSRRPKTDAERAREYRARKKLADDERLKRLLAKRIKLDLYHATSEALDQIMQEAGIDDPQDVITRLIHGAKYLTTEQKEKIFS